MKNNEIQIIYPNNKSYPKQFNFIKNKPKKIYAQGNIELLNKSCISSFSAAVRYHPALQVYIRRFLSDETAVQT